MPTTTRLGAVLLGSVLAAGLAQPALASTPVAPQARLVRPAADTQADWLARINQMRAQYGAGPLTIDATLTRHAQSWSQQMAARGQISHGDLVGAQNVAASYGRDASAVAFIEQWASAPYHQVNQLHPSLNRVGIGLATGSDGMTYATLNLSSQGPTPAAQWPQVWPTGSETLTRYSGGEMPDPMANCPRPTGDGYGLPIVVGMAERGTQATGWSATLKQDGAPVEVCITPNRESAFIIPLRPLAPGAHYTGSVRATVAGQARTATIDFTSGKGSDPAPVVTPTATPTATPKPVVTPSPVTPPRPTVTPTPIPPRPVTTPKPVVPTATPTASPTPTPAPRPAPEPRDDIHQRIIDVIRDLIRRFG